MECQSKTAGDARQVSPIDRRGALAGLRDHACLVRHITRSQLPWSGLVRSSGPLPVCVRWRLEVDGDEPRPTPRALETIAEQRQREVFIIDLIGNALAFGSRVANAFVTAVVFAVVFGALVYFGYGNITMSVSTTPSSTAPATK